MQLVCSSLLGCWLYSFLAMSFSNALVPFSPGRIPAGFKSLPHLTASDYNRSLINNLRSSSIIFFPKIQNPLLRLKHLARSRRSSRGQLQSWAAVGVNKAAVVAEWISGGRHIQETWNMMPSIGTSKALPLRLPAYAYALWCFNSFSFSANQMLILCIFSG